MQSLNFVGSDFSEENRPLIVNVWPHFSESCGRGEN